MIKIISAKSALTINQAQKLFLEYASSLTFDLDFQDFKNELGGLPGEYAPPDGRLFVATEGRRVVGCVALRKISGKICEMKRLYVRPMFRGKGIGLRLAETVIEEARKIGYTRMRLDTTPSMTAAIALYRSLGFKKTAPYRHNPVHGALFMELVLSK